MPKTVSRKRSRSQRGRGKNSKRRVKKAPPPPAPKKEKALATLGQLTQDVGDVDIATMVTNEHKRLLRTYRLMEDTRRQITEKGNNLNKKERFVELLRAEKEDLETDLKNATCETYKARDRASVKTILKILQDYEKCVANIDDCLKLVREMETNVDKITKKLVEQKLKVQELYGQSMTVPQSERRERVLENRLYHVTTQFDTKVSMNKELREEINMMLKLRGVFFERMILMKRQTNRIKRRMGEIVYSATQVYEQRDDYVTKIHSLRDKNDKDSKQHVLEIKEFKRVLRHDAKIHGFMSLKNMERELMENSAQRNDRKNQAKLSEIEQTVANYERSFREIMNIAEFKDIESIMGKYMEQEQMNFSRFKYITDVNHEINSLRDQNITLAKEIEQLYAENKMIEKGRQNELKEMSMKCDTENVKLDVAIEKWNAAEAQMDDVIHLLDNIFQVANCSNASIIQLLGNMQGISPRNAILCVKVIEKRVDELLFEKAKYEIRKAVEIDKVPLTKKANFVVAPKSKQAGGPFLPKITVTGRLDGEQEEEEEEDKAFMERPFSYDEMKKRIQNKFQTVKAPDKVNPLTQGTGAEVDFDRSEESILTINRSRASHAQGADNSEIKDKSETAT